MVAVDSSTLIAYIQGDAGVDVRALDDAFAVGEVVLPPVVLTEVLSEPTLTQKPGLEAMLLAFPVLPIDEGYWARTAGTRATILAKKLRARLPDVLIAQSCIDHGIALLTRDSDFRHFAKHCGLKLA